MSNLNYTDITIQQSQKKFSLMKEKMLEPIKQVQQARKENLRNLLAKIEKNKTYSKKKELV